MLADPELDAVSVTTMWDQHAAPALAALQAGKHVFLEKPMASHHRRLRRDRERRQRGKDLFHGRPHLPLQSALPPASRKSPRARSARSFPCMPAAICRRGWRLGARQDRPHHRRLRTRHRPDVLVQRLRAVRAYAQTVKFRNHAHPDLGHVMYRLESGASASWNRSGACRTPPPFRSTNGSRSSAARVRSPSTTPSPISASLRATSFTAPTPPIGRNSTARAVAP